MSQYSITGNFTSNGNILPNSFVKGDTGNSRFVLQCGSGDTPLGISGNWTRNAPGTAADDGNESIATEEQPVFIMGAYVQLQCGATGTWTPFVFLKPDAAGLGTPCTAASDIAGAISLQAANPGELSPVIVIPPGGQGSGSATQPIIVATGSQTLLASQSGFLIDETGADKTLTTPTGAVGLRYKVMATGNAVSSGSVGTILHIPSGDTLNGQLVVGTNLVPASAKGAVNTQATAKQGDFVEITCLSPQTWWVTDVQGVWVREA